METEVKNHLRRFKRDGLTADELVVEIYLINRENKNFPLFKEKVLNALNNLGAKKDKNGIYKLN